jgi:hypothetical protein
LARAKKVEGYSVMSDTITLAKVEEFFRCEDSDEALERAASKEPAGYTLLYCTSQDCSMVHS